MQKSAGLKGPKPSCTLQDPNTASSGLFLTKIIKTGFSHVFFSTIAP
jgi:hypothetical protein